MTMRGKPDEVIAQWMALPARIRKAVRGLSEARLDDRADPGHMSYRETVHHLVEANLIASNMIIAALAKSGSTFDWTWVTPGGTWMQKLGYGKAPIGPALSTLSGLTRHLAAILSGLPDGLQRTIVLYDTPESTRYSKTVRQILGDEVSHAHQHLGELPRTAPRKRRETSPRPIPRRRGVKTRRNPR